MSSSLLLGLGGVPEHEFTCSRAGCGHAATWKLLWRNPKIHPEDRRKTWLACDEHIEFLREFLAARNFPLTTEVIGDEASEAGGDNG